MLAGCPDYYGSYLIPDAVVKLMCNDLVSIILATNQINPAPSMRVPSHELHTKRRQSRI